jgi:hypothetical protein
VGGGAETEHLGVRKAESGALSWGPVIFDLSALRREELHKCRRVGSFSKVIAEGLCATLACSIISSQVVGPSAGKAKLTGREVRPRSPTLSRLELF